MKHRTVAAALAALALAAGASRASAAQPIDSPQLNVYAWVERNQTGSADPLTTFGASVEGSVPILHTKADGSTVSLLSLGAALDLTAAPGAALDLTNPDTFGRVIGAQAFIERKLTWGTIAGKDVRLSARCQGGFLTALSENEPVDRYWRHYTCGPALDVAAGGTRRADLYAGYGWDQRASPEAFAGGQLLLQGYVPIAGLGEQGEFMLGMDASLNVRSPECTGPLAGPAPCPLQRDAVKVYVGFAYKR